VAKPCDCKEEQQCGTCLYFYAEDGAHLGECERLDDHVVEHAPDSWCPHWRCRKCGGGGEEMTDYQPREWQLGEACRHGSLGRQCETCQAQHELAWALAEVERLRDEVERLRAALTEIAHLGHNSLQNATRLARAVVTAQRALEVKP